MKMKKYLFLLTAMFSILFMAGCDALEDFTVNVPFTVAFTDSTNSTETFDNETYDLADNSVYQEYQEKIEDFEFLEARYNVKETLPDTLTGTMTFTVNKNDSLGEEIFSQVFPNVKVYKDATDMLVLTQAQIQMFNAYLLNMYANAGTTKFYGEAVVSGLTDDGTLKKIVVELHLLLKAKGNL